MAMQHPRLLMSILAVATGLPATLALMYYLYTGDQTLRPFGLTKHHTAAAPTNPATPEILVHVNWGQNADSVMTQAEIRTALAKALSVYDIEYRVKVAPNASGRSDVIYIVGHNQIGPFALHNAAQGIPAALAAYRLMQPQSGPE